MNELRKLENRVKDLEERLKKLENEIHSPKTLEDKEFMDILYKKAKELVIKQQKASITFLQRKLWIDFHRAKQLLNQLEKEGVIGPEIGTQSRKILVKVSSLFNPKPVRLYY